MLHVWDSGDMHKEFWWKVLRKTDTWKIRESRWEGNIKMDLQKKEWWKLVIVVMNFLIPLFLD
jgi:hypothetical protein